MTSESSLLSPRLITLQQELAAENTAALDAFWQEVSHQGTPLIESVARGYEVHYREFSGGHNPLNWALADGLLALIGKNADSFLVGD